MEPTDMPDFPQYGIDDRKHRPHQLLDREIISEAKGKVTRLAQLRDEIVGCSAARRAV
jgi:hypothetical protein